MFTIQACIRPDISTICPDILQSSRRIQRSSTSVRTTWQYRSDASRCSTSKRISFADTDMGRQLQPSGHQVYTVRMLSLIRQEVEKNSNRPDVKATPSGRHSLLWKLRTIECNHPDAKATSSGCRLIQERFFSAFWNAGCTVVHSDAA
jgi:hypothetical protein